MVKFMCRLTVYGGVEIKMSLHFEMLSLTDGSDCSSTHMFVNRQL